MHSNLMICKSFSLLSLKQQKAPLFKKICYMASLDYSCTSLNSKWFYPSSWTPTVLVLEGYSVSPSLKSVDKVGNEKYLPSWVN